jgi:hypothetical protein
MEKLLRISLRIYANCESGLARSCAPAGVGATVRRGVAAVYIKEEGGCVKIAAV